MGQTSKKIGAPTKFTEEMVERIEIVATAGLTDKQMAKILGISESTLNNWKNKHAGFLESIKDWKDVADKEMEVALFHRGKGYSHPEDKIFIVNGEPLVVPTTKHYPPDTAAAFIWLKNRKPNEWRDKIDHDHTTNGESLSGIVFNISNENSAEEMKKALGL